jgi:hypothetical protein
MRVADASRRLRWIIEVTVAQMDDEYFRGRIA